jgi:uncharacterized protein (DUF1697 family)
MDRFAVLLRGINVGGKNPVPMARLRAVIEELGFSGVATYIASGNAIVESDRTAAEISALIEAALPRQFSLHDEVVRALVLPQAHLASVVANRPDGFGSQPDTYHSDAVFLIGIDAATAMTAFSPREGVDAVWPGDGVVYSQRLSAERTKSRLSKVMESPLYKSMTIRNWNTTTTLLGMLQARDEQPGA